MVWAGDPLALITEPYQRHFLTSTLQYLIANHCLNFVVKRACPRGNIAVVLGVKWNCRVQIPSPTLWLSKFSHNNCKQVADLLCLNSVSKRLVSDEFIVSTGGQDGEVN